MELVTGPQLPALLSWQELPPQKTPLKLLANRSLFFSADEQKLKAAEQDEQQEHTKPSLNPEAHTRVANSACGAC